MNPMDLKSIITTSIKDLLPESATLICRYYNFTTTLMSESRVEIAS